MALQEVERVTAAKLDWYISPVELIQGNDNIYTSLLGFLFYWHSCLDRPCSQTSLIL